MTAKTKNPAPSPSLEMHETKKDAEDKEMATRKELEAAKELESSPSVFKNWCIKTSCHGFSDAATARTWFERIFWMVIVLVSFAVITPQLYYLMLDYANQEQWVSSTYEVARPNLPLPQIVICNYNRINYTKAVEKYHLNESHLLYINRQFYNPSYILNSSVASSTRAEELLQYQEWRSGPHGNNISFKNLLHDLGHDCADTISFMVYGRKNIGDPCKYVKIIESIQLGACLSLKTPEELGPVSRSGHLDGLKLLLDTNDEDYEPDVINRYLDSGFALFMYYESLPDQWLSLSPGFHHWISIRAQRTLINTERRFSLLNMILGNSDEEKPCTTDRQGRTLSLEGLNVAYNKFVCQFDCELGAILEKCGCVPLVSYTKKPPCEPHVLDACLVQWAAEQNTAASHVAHEFSANCSRACKHACNEQFVSYKLSMSRFPAPAKLQALQNHLGGNISLTHLEKNYVRLDIFFDSLTIYTVEWRERMSVSELISMTGGQLGLCAGISFITIAQACWYLGVGTTNFALQRLKRKKKIYTVGQSESTTNQELGAKNEEAAL